MNHKHKSLTARDERFILDNYRRMTSKAMAGILGKSKHYVDGFKEQKGLGRPATNETNSDSIDYITKLQIGVNGIFNEMAHEDWLT